MAHIPCTQGRRVTLSRGEGGLTSQTRCHFVTGQTAGKQAKTGTQINQTSALRRPKFSWGITVHDFGLWEEPLYPAEPTRLWCVVLQDYIEATAR